MKNKIFFSMILFTGLTFILSAYAQEDQRKGYWREKLRSRRQIIKNTNRAKIKKIGEGIYSKWSHTKNLIAFNKVVNGKFEIFAMRPDGSDLKCLTCNKPELPHSNKGQPYWHASGEYIVFTAENTNYKRAGLGLGLAEMPGIGHNQNIWIMKSDGTQFWQITDYEENWGVFRPSFSHNGKMLYWNEEYSMEKYPGVGSSWKWPGSSATWLRDNPKGEEWGLIRIKIADISFEANGPKISNIRSIVHHGLTLLEGSGFTPDDNGFLFTSANTSETGGSAYWGGDIYTSDLNGGSVTRLTNTPYKHDENAEYSPDGKKIVWSQAKGSPGDRVDIYIMDRDGKNKTRLTYFSEPGHPEYIPDAVGGCGEIDWSPDGEKIIFGIGTGNNLNTHF
jgi:Tol biopolymer transport system component